MEVIKRDGRIVPFEIEKIKTAIIKAFIEVDGENINIEDVELKANLIATQILNTKKSRLSVEEIQDIVEEKLMASNRKDVARAYIRYRYKHNMARDKYHEMMDTVGEKLKATNVQNQNANVDEHSFGGRIGEATNEVMKKYALDFCMSEKTKQNHLNNRIYVHDLDHYAVGCHNCLTIPFDDLLKNGFNTRQVDIRPANSLNTAFQLVAVIFQLQSLMQYGGVSASHLDHTMVPYFRKSFWKHYLDGLMYIYEIVPENFPNEPVAELPIENSWYTAPEYNKAYAYAMQQTKKELQQAVEGMYHNLNSLQSRSGNQLPFTSINYGTCTSTEGRLIIKAILEGSIKGVGRLHRTSVFPCGIFQVGEGINKNPGDPNYDLFQLALKSTAQRLYPNYANINWSGNAGYDKNDPRTFFSTMGCRTANGWDVNGFGQLKDGRGNLAPTTIILPTIAMEAKEKYEELRKDYDYTLEEIFFDMLDGAIYDAKDSLIERYNWLCAQPVNAAKFMYENGLMAGFDGENIESALKHGTLAIGQLGLAEALQILIGCNHTTDIGMKFAHKIEQLFRARCDEFKNEYKLNFGVYYTPAENLCHTAMKKFKAKYGELPNISDREYFTNSMHIPVWEKVSVFEKINLESQLTGYSNAGCITYVEFDSSAKNNLQALETVVKYAMDKDIPYFAINVPNDTCMSCGYTDELNDECIQCGGTDIQRLRRVTGYLTGNYTTAFNKGKQQEVANRITHSRISAKENN